MQPAQLSRGATVTRQHAAVPVTRHRSSAADLRRRIDAAALLLADGLPRTAAVTQLVERYCVDRRTARRYVAAAAEQLVAEIGTADLQASLAETVERLRRLAYQAEQQGNLNAAVGAEKAAAATLVAIHRADLLTAARLHGHIVAAVEPTAAQRRRYRQSTSPPF
jgi:hypothetical protein